MKKRLLKVSKNIVNLDFVHRFVYIFRLVTNPFKAKYSSAWLEKVIRHSFFQENNFLPFWNRASKRRSNPNPWSKVRSFLFVKSNNFVYIFILFCSKVFHVRSVTQGDVIRAEAKDIPRIFQVKKQILVYILFTNLFCLHLFEFGVDFIDFVRWWRRVSQTRGQHWRW